MTVAAPATPSPSLGFGAKATIEELRPATDYFFKVRAHCSESGLLGCHGGARLQLAVAAARVGKFGQLVVNEPRGVRVHKGRRAQVPNALRRELPPPEREEAARRVDDDCSSEQISRGNGGG